MPAYAAPRPKSVTIGARQVGPGHPVYVVAELSGNHNGSLDRALATVGAAAAAGVDAVKLQTYTADTITLRSKDPAFTVPGSGPWSGRTLWDLYDEAHTPWEWHEPLFREARKHKLDVFSTPFDDTAVEFLSALDVVAFKVASFEMMDDLLLRAIAVRNRPVIVSTGMATLEEIAHARETLVRGGANELIFLKCTSGYPAPDEELNLSSIPVLEAATACPVGLSDHSLGLSASVTAVALGACLVEKHLTLSRADGGVDSHFSLEPEEFAALVLEIRRTEAMLGTPGFGPTASEKDNIVFRRSLYVVRPTAAGEPFTTENVRSIRPGYGLAPKFADIVFASRARRDIDAGTPLAWSDLAG